MILTGPEIERYLDRGVNLTLSMVDSKLFFTFLSVNYTPSTLAFYARSSSEFDHRLLIFSSQSPDEYNISISEIRDTGPASLHICSNETQS